ncbi:DUF4870 domain-containing protein [Acholeplasma vituli]|uniref:DUF4870 domain-containing protein n=1 Tax=Paracholeplasma vituli TaxID=69473 RepID=A0ABT2PX36_9MOLU|nr:DUF4870 domain-containing protein [Paracholeplasma vituli]MCU0104213.1 DUF4870 domain-containing protein [Paracholeplasma vituli]
MNNNKQVWGMDVRTLLMLGWLVQLIVPVGGMIAAIVLMTYFKDERNRDDFLTEGFRQISNFALIMYIISLVIGTVAGVFMLIPFIGMLIGIILFIVLGVYMIYSLYVYIKGAIEAGNGNIFKPGFSFEIFK